MEMRRYYLDYYAALPTELDAEEYEEFADEDFDNDMYCLSHDRAVKVAIDNIRKSLKFLVEETDVAWNIEPVDYKEKFDGGYPVNAIVFVDSVHCDINPLAVIREDEF